MLLYFTIILQFLQIQSQESQLLQLRQLVGGYITPDFNTNQQYFTFVVPDIIENENLIVMLQSNNPTGQMRVTISRYHAKPIEIDQGDVIVCAPYQEQLCILNNEIVKGGETLYMSVICFSPSYYKFKIVSEKEIQGELKLYETDFLQFQINEGESRQISFYEQTKKIMFRFCIHIQCCENDIDSLTLTSNFDETQLYQLDEGIDLYMRDYTQKAVCWHALVHPNQVFTLQSKKKLILEAKSQEFKYIQDIHLFEYVQIKTDAKYQQIFKLNVNKDTNCNYVLKFITPEKHQTLYIHPNYLPERYEDFLMQQLPDMRFYFFNFIVLQREGIEVESFYIVAKSDEKIESAFYFECCIPTDGQCVNYLETDFTYKSKIKQKQDLEFSIIGIKQMQIHYDLHIKSIKGSFQIILYDCSFVNMMMLCNFESEIANQQERRYFSISEGKTFKQEIECKFELQCHWKIIIRLDDTEKDGFFEIDYTAIDFYFKIFPQQSFYEFIRSPNFMEKFQFQMTDFSNIERIQFQVTFFFGSGEINLHKFSINNKEDEIKSKDNYIILDTSNTNFQELREITIYIKTKQIEEFGITSWVLRKATAKKQLGFDPNDYLNIFSFGQTELDLNGDLPLYLKYEMQISNEGSAKLGGIYFHKFFGSIEIIGYTHLDHNGPVIKWRSKDFLIFNIKELSGQTILLRVKNTNGYQKSRIRIQPGIHYKNQLNTIQMNIPQFHTFDQLSYITFISLLQNLEPIQLSSNQLFTEYNFIFMNMNTNYNKVNEIKKAAINNGLAIDLFDNVQFTIFLYQEHFTMILVSKFDLNVIDLIQGFWIKKVMPQTNDYFNIYSNGQEIHLGIIANTKNLEIFIRFVKYKDEQFPDSENYDIYLEHQQSERPQFYFLSNQQFADFGCQESCIVKITLHHKNQESNSQIIELRILYQSKLSVLNRMIQSLGCAQNNNIQYFTFDSSQNLQQLSILIQSNECKLKYNIFKNIVPQQQSSQMKPISKFSQIIRVEETDKIFENQQGDLFLAIEGQEGCHFSINFNVGTNYQAFKIFPNTLYQLQLENEDKMFLLIDDLQMNDFLISMQSQTNLARFYIANINYINLEIIDFVKKQPFETYLNHNQNSGYRNYFKGRKIVVLNVLLVAIESLGRDTIFIQILNSDQHSPTLQKDYKYSFTITELKQEDFLIKEKSNQIYFFFKVLEGEIDLFYQKSLVKLSDDENMNELEFTDFNNMKLAIINKEKDENIYIRIKFYYGSSIEFYYSTDKIRLISPTYLEKVILKQMSEEVLIFKNSQLLNSQVQDDDLFFSLQVFLSVFSEQESIDKIEKSINLQVEVKRMNNEILQPILFIRNSDSYYFEFEREAIDYQIIIRNLDDYQQQYSILINIAKSQRLEKAIKHISTIEQQEVNHFSISQIERGVDFLFYDIQICSGQFQISANYNFTNLKAKQENKIINQNNEQHLLGFIEFNSPQQYFQFQLKDLDKQQELNYFTLRVYQVESNLDIPISQVQIIDDGNFELMVLQVEDESITLQITFNAIEYYQSLNPSNVLKYIEYYILLLDEPDEQQNFNYCIPPQQKITRIYKENQETIITYIEVPKQYQYYVNIQATMNFLIREEFEIKLDFYYEPQHLLIEQLRGEDSSLNINPNYIEYGAILGSSALIYQFQKIFKRKRNRQQNQSNDINQQLNNEVQEIELNQSNL